MGRIKDGGGDDGDPVRSPLGLPPSGGPTGAVEAGGAITPLFNRAILFVHADLSLVARKHGDRIDVLFMAVDH